MKLIVTILLFINAGSCYAQSPITGRILNAETNDPLANVSILEKSSGKGTVSALDGSFSLQTTINNSTLIISLAGFTTIEVSANNLANNKSILLSALTKVLSDVVVTALGIQRDKKQLGYAVQSLSSKELTDVKQTNLINAFSGRLSGVQVTNGSSGVGSSARVVIRGENSLSGTNQPLFVVDGIPISNSVVTNNTENNETGFQEVDYGNGAADINPDDIESVTVLKGAGAAALYGSRASSGVIVIKTKDGGKKGRGINFSSSVTFDKPLVLPQYQNIYGAGAGGLFSFEDGFGAGSNDGGLTSFGPRMMGQLIKQFNGPSKDQNGRPLRGGDIIARNGNAITPTPFVAHPDNVKDFYRTGITLSNNIAVYSGTDEAGIRLSYMNLDNKGIVPNSDFKKNSFALSARGSISEKLSARAFVNYINTSSSNRPGLGYGSENPMYTFNWTGRQVDTRDLKSYWQAGRIGFNQFNSNYLWLDNPYFTTFENTNAFDKNRFVVNAAITYEFTPGLSLRVRSGLDYYHDLRKSKRAFSTKRFANGAYREDEIDYRELNTDFLLSFDKKLLNDIRYNVSAGGNILSQESGYKSNTANQLSVPEIYNFGNSKVPLVSTQEINKKQINSLFMFGNVGYKEFLFVDLTYRNDWSSTLPVKNNSYGYYSASVALLLSEMMHMPSAINYSKVRFNYASVGADTDPYQLNNTFVFNQNFGSTPLLTSSTRFLNPNLKPEKLKALELGLDLNFFNNRLGLDASVYQNTSSDQIINLPASSSSGFTSRVVNGGKIRSRGIEISLKTAAVRSKNFKWTNIINFSLNRSYVIELPQGVDQYVTGFESLYASSDNTVYFIASPANKGRVGDMYGTGLLKVDGQTVYDSKGFPVRDATLRNLGNYNPDFTLGFGNEFSYKNISLNFLWDWRQGGVLLSRTFSLGSTSGILESTLPGRDGGVIGQGITNVGTTNAPKYVPNSISISAADYYGQYYNRANESTSIFDATYLKLRQVSLSYSLPKNFVSKIGASDIKFGLVMNNVLLFTENPNVDPEVNAVQGRKYVYGVDDMSLPSTRSIGLNLNVNF